MVFAFALGWAASGGLGQAPLFPAGYQLDTRDREAVRRLYLGVYARSEQVPSGWAGSSDSGDAGSTTAAFRETVALRVNYFRALAGVPAGIVLDPVYNATAQQAALMMSANRSLSHQPPPSWRFYTPAGAEAALRSNLALSFTGSTAVTGYLADGGVGNDNVGHRRWILYPQTERMGTGDVDIQRNYPAANALHVVDDRVFAPRPATRDGFVAWPPPGFVPHANVFYRWSISLADADFRLATVTMTRDGVPVPVRREAVVGGFGEPTLAWVPDGLDADRDFINPYPAPAADTTYRVAVDNVRIGGLPRNLVYDVVVFDPEVGAPPPRLTGPASTSAGLPNRFVPEGTGNESYQVVAGQHRPWTAVLGAESNRPEVVLRTSGYPAVVTDAAASGLASWRLAHALPVDQVLAIDRAFLVRPGGRLHFQSRLGFAQPGQAAVVEISLDEGGSWRTVYTQTGRTEATGAETLFRPVTVNLEPWVGRRLQVRFVYRYLDGSFFSQTDPGIGWYLDDIRFEAVDEWFASARSDLEAGDDFSVSFPGPGAWAVAARSRVLERYFLEWGPVSLVSVGPGPAAPARLANLSTRATAGLGASTLIGGFTIGGTSPKRVLVRAAGPALRAFGLEGAVPDPRLTLLRGADVLATNDNWDDTIEAPDVAQTASQVGAFPFAPGSRDAALVLTLAPGAYTAQVDAASATTGLALVEIFDADLPGNGGRLINLSTRARVEAGAGLVIPGLVVDGTGTERLLVRAVGPGLTAFGVTDLLADPRFELVAADGRVLLANDDWGAASGEDPAAAAAATGAFALAPGSRDAASTVSLPPGVYTVKVTGAGGSTGVVLVEVYRLP